MAEQEGGEVQEGVVVTDAVCLFCSQESVREVSMPLAEHVAISTIQDSRSAPAFASRP